MIWAPPGFPTLLLEGHYFNNNAMIKILANTCYPTRERWQPRPNHRVESLLFSGNQDYFVMLGIHNGMIDCPKNRRNRFFGIQFYIRIHFLLSVPKPIRKTVGIGFAVQDSLINCNWHGKTRKSHILVRTAYLVVVVIKSMSYYVCSDNISSFPCDICM